MHRVGEWVDEEIYESVLLWFHKIERIENDRIVNMVYLGECVVLGNLWKSWIDSVNDCLKKSVMYDGHGL